jgi:hypothetical protein
MNMGHPSSTKNRCKIVSAVLAADDFRRRWIGAAYEPGEHFACSTLLAPSNVARALLANQTMIAYV